VAVPIKATVTNESVIGSRRELKKQLIITTIIIVVIIPVAVLLREHKSVGAQLESHHSHYGQVMCAVAQSGYMHHHLRDGSPRSSAERLYAPSFTRR
jgi:hypothetical protein